MLYPVELRALRPLSGTYGWPPGVNGTTMVMPGGVFTTDNEKAKKLEAAGLAERAERAPAQVVQPSDEVAAMIRSLKAKMMKPVEAPVMESPENKMVEVEEDKSEDEACWCGAKLGHRGRHRNR